MNFKVEFNTGAGDFTIDADDIACAMAQADEQASYTQQDIHIYDDDGNKLASRIWYGYAYDDDDTTLRCDNPIIFGTLGFYDDWIIF